MAGNGVSWQVMGCQVYTIHYYCKNGIMGHRIMDEQNNEILNQ